MEPQEHKQSPARKSADMALVESVTNEVVDCWNQIGAAGDGSCVELSRVVHCRNCSVYAAAGVKLLDRSLPLNYRREWTEHFAIEKKRALSGWNSAVVFRIGMEWLALPTRAFREVAERRRVHSLPHRRDGMVLGLINVRGELLICVSLARLLGIKTAPPMPRGAHERLVVTEWRDGALAFPVEEIEGIHRYQTDDLKPASASLASSEKNFTTGLITWRDKTIGCLDANLVFSTLNRSLA